MALRIKWTKSANNDFNLIVDFLVSEWNNTVVKKFLRILRSKLETISYFPYLGSQLSNDKRIRALLVTKHSRMYYRVNKNIIIILRLFDTRKDPGKFTL